MPPTSNMRKSSATTMAAGAVEPHPHPQIQALYQPRRTTSGRAIHRPANYYARPFGLHGTAADHDANGVDSPDAQHHGFFPALQYFTDAITALPKEVMKQFTLMKEVEAKLHGPSETLVELIDALLAQPVPPHRQGGASTAGAAGQALLSFTAHNSISGSANVSVINGVAGQASMRESINGSVNGEEQQVDSPQEVARRMQFREMCQGIQSMLPNLDEKVGVLEEANRVLALQLMRIDQVMPHIETEISEEARLGSMTHWAYSDNRQKKHAANAAGSRGRDVAAANSLAAAASLIHENDISTARINAGREATREKTKGKRVEHPGDSDFDEKPKKQKLGKGRAAASAAGPAGLGVTVNGEPIKQRKKNVDKGATAAGMERTISTTGRASKAARETPRSTPLMEQTASKKAPKAKTAPPPPKKKPTASIQASPMLASSPLAASFSPAGVEAAPSSRPQSTRLRHNSTATNPRHESLQDEDAGSGPPSVAGRSNGAVEKTNSRRKGNDAAEDQEDKLAALSSTDLQTEQRLTEAAEQLKREDTEMPDASTATAPAPAPSNPGSGSQSNKNTSGRGSAVGTPKTESFPTSATAEAPSMVRTRSTRSKPTAGAEGRESDSSEGPAGGPGVNRHRRAISNSHLVKQLAPFNRSPDLDRHRGRDDMDEDIDDAEGRALEEGKHAPSEPEAMEIDPAAEEQGEARPTIERGVGATGARRASARRPVSRRDTGALPSSPPPGPSGAERDSSPEDPAAMSPAPDAVSGASSASTRQQQRPTQSASRGIPPVSSTPNLHSAPNATSVPELEPDDDDDERPSDAEPASDPDLASDADEEEEEEEDDDDDDQDPDDPNEQKYCYCNRGSYGEMVACDNDDCPREWFHLGCTELREAPGEEEVWFCRECRPRPLPRGSSSAGQRGGKSASKGRAAKGR